jgi:hypothetical protein
VFEDLHVPYAVVGSMASSYFGEARATNDVDIVADLAMEQAEAFVARFPEQDFYVSDAAVRQAIAVRTQFNIIHPESGLKLDVMIPVIGEHSADELKRRIRAELSEGPAFFAAPEDVIIKKLEFYREGGSDKHLRDIAGMLRVSGSRIDRGYIEAWVRKRDVDDIWQAILARIP